MVSMRLHRVANRHRQARTGRRTEIIPEFTRSRTSVTNVLVNHPTAWAQRACYFLSGMNSSLELDSEDLLSDTSITPKHQRSQSVRTVHWWYVLFFISGFPALLYQIVWQRALFAIYGVNIESVTIVVTAFMLGLGLGSLAGGALSQRQAFPVLPAFGFAELGIALFGVASLKVFHWAALFSAGAPPLETGVMVLMLVLVPTVLMGSTLPLLVAHTVRINANVGVSVGALYAANTLGSAAACLAAGMFLMWHFGESGCVRFAAALNAFVGSAVLVWCWRTGRSDAKQNPIQRDQDRDMDHREDRINTGTISFALTTVFVAISGMIALAYEILWYRLFSYVTGSWAKSFAYLLSAYLAGVGFGSLASERICERKQTPQRFLVFVASFVLLANVLGFLVAPALAEVVRRAHFSWTLLLVMVAAAFLGVAFPLLCHISVAPN